MFEREKEVHHQRLLVKFIASSVQRKSEAMQAIEHRLSCLAISISKLEKGHDLNVQRLNRLEEYTARSEKQPFASQPDPMIKGTAVLSDRSIL